jgi:hypothetical protein
MAVGPAMAATTLTVRTLRFKRWSVTIGFMTNSPSSIEEWPTAAAWSALAATSIDTDLYRRTLMYTDLYRFASSVLEKKSGGYD